MTTLKEKNVLITGAASGIGKLMAEKMGALGAQLILWDIAEEPLQEIQKKLAAQKIKVKTYTCDLTKKKDIYDTAKQVLRDFKHIDILINNAGVVSGKALLDASDEDIERTFDVNTLALFRTTRAFLPAMIERNSGHIVTVASAAGLVGTAKLIDYCSSKFAAIGFDESLRLEIQRQGLKIQTTVVCPFYIDTGMFTGVKTKFSWLLPILKPEYVVKQVIHAIQTNQKRLLLPRFVWTVFPFRTMPTKLFDGLVNFLGITKSMDEFKGRK